MERTISISMGKGSLAHNNRKFVAENVDRSRVPDNVIYRQEDLKAVYHKLFDNALQEYNSRQKRKDRKIVVYYEKIRQSRQEKLFYEMIVQIGNRDDMGVKDSEMAGLAKEILSEYMEEFQTRNPNLYVFNAVLHMDEATPNLHIDFVPYITDSRRGLTVRNALKGALAAQGFVGEGKRCSEWSRWTDSEKEALAGVMERYEIRWKQLGTKEEHLSVYDFKKKKRKEEVQILEHEIGQKAVELSDTVVKKEQVQKEVDSLGEIKKSQADIIADNRETIQKLDTMISEKDDESHRQKESVENCISAVTRFMAGLNRKFGNYMGVTRAELYREEVAVDRRGHRSVRLIPDFHIRMIPEEREKFRDLPTKAFELLVPMAFRYAPDIAFAMCLQAFAGLRAGEALNVRREDSPLGAGIVFTRTAGNVRDVRIDLRRVLVLRSDGMAVGRIKKPRIQHVYPAFLGAFCTAYDLHMKYINGRQYEEAYAPVMINRNGKALAYDSYRKKFGELVDRHFRPALLGSSDPELRVYGQLLCEHHLTLHSLRHWFTVQLVLRGENIAGIQYWRGDTSPQSAFEYLQNKGDLVRELRTADERLTKILMAAGKEIYGQK